MNRKFFLLIAGLILATGFICPPILKQLEDKGILKEISVGNTYEKPEYSENPLYYVKNGIDFLKYNVNETYGNYLPGAQNNVIAYNNLMDKVNAPLAFLSVTKTDTDTLDKLNGLNGGTSTPAPSNTAAPTEILLPTPQVTQQPGTTPTDTPLPTATYTPAPTPTPARTITDVSYKYIKKDNSRKYYRVNVKDSYGGDYTFLEATCLQPLDKLKQIAVKQAGLVNRLYEANKDVNFYLYVARRLQDHEYFANLIPEEISTAEAVDAFYGALNPGIIRSEYRFNTLFERIDRNYFTDHHWNALGSDVGYKDIISMMRANTPEILPAFDYSTIHRLEKGKFYGSFARNCALQNMWDIFDTAEYNLPVHKISSESYSDRLAPLVANPPVSINKNTYALMYPKTASYDYTENKTGRNLLILGDSYSQAITEEIAASFDKTYVLYFTNYSGVDYNAFIEKYGITDVLLLEYSERIIYDAIGDCYLSKIVVK